jgi:hypothetical protein
MAKARNPRRDKSTHNQNHRGIVRRVDPAVREKGADETFSPDYTVTSTVDEGGQLLTDVEVILCFWGSFWSTTPPPTPSRADYEKAIQGILTGPYMGGLSQYRGVGQARLVFSEINDTSNPANGYTDADVVAMLRDRLQNTSMPRPAAGHDRFYAVILPQGINNSLTQFAGQHQSFTFNGVTGWYAWVDNTGSLTGHNCVTKVLSHELVEACTNPNVDTSNDGILVNGTTSGGKAVTNDEIGDTCNNEFATVDMNGINCSVQSYWSKADNTCILPLGTLAFWTDKNTFGKDEVVDVIATSGGTWEKAFWLVVEGFSKNAFNSLNVTVPLPTGAFANLVGVSIAQNPDIDFENGANPDVRQRIRIPFDITFTNASLNDFPSSGSQTYELDAFIATDGNKVPGSDAAALFELVAGADPYFTNIDPTQNNVFYLSQDLRVFTATPRLNGTPVPGGPAFGSDSTAGAFSYIQQLLAWLNAHFSDPNATDPFNSVLPGQSGALQGDSSVTPFSIQPIFSPPFFRLLNNYNFAIARVRMRGSSGSAGEAQNARVFFRLWTTQSPDTDYSTGSTYPSDLDTAGLPAAPQVGADHVTLPFFATGNFGSNNDYGAGGINNQDITIPSGADSIWVYYGCFLNVYDAGNVIDGLPVQAWLNGTHHCLVAQIAFDGAPIFAGANPEASDKLAQRNLQITHSDNPGPASAHRIPQTFDIRPSAAANQPGQVDELMIDWGSVPAGTVASIYWPQVPAAQVLALANGLYKAHTLSAADNHTIQCKITGGVTYIPVPMSAGANFAGLFTLDLPATVVAGQEFNVVVRRVSSQEVPIIEIAARRGPPRGGRKPTGQDRNAIRWRYVVGTFQVKIPVSTAAVLLRPEENTLAILKWRLQQIPVSSRWHPVLQRYISYIADRVTGLGGDPNAIPPSPNGAPVSVVEPCDDVVEHCGKVTEVVFDCFGDLEGFVLSSCCELIRFTSRESGIGELVLKACKERLPLCVFVSRHDKSKIRRIVVKTS